MFRGYNRPRKSDIFGPSSTGGTFNDVRRRQIYQEGEGIGSIFSSIFRNIIPFATKAVKKIASSSLAKETGKALKESAISGLTNVVADVISGDRNFEESVSDNLLKARENISTAIKTSASSRKRGSNVVKTKVKSKGNKKKKRRKIKSSVFDDDYD